MSHDRKLRLVPLKAVDPENDEEAAFSDEELREAVALREALDRGDDSLAGALRAAWEPSALDAGDLEALLDRALGDGEAAPTRAERKAADELRDELECGAGLRDDLAILGELRAAYRPSELAPARNEELIAAALARAPKVVRLRRALPVTMATLTGFAALAAGVALMMTNAAPTVQSASRAPSAAAPSVESVASVASVARSPLIRSRSTDDLFDPAEKFPASGEESARVDRIASARRADLRANRYASWGVR